MKSLKENSNVTYVFSQTTLLEALEEWQSEQIDHYPNQAERINITVVAMQHFLRSQQVKDHKMIVSGEPKDFVIEFPKSVLDGDTHSEKTKY